MTKNNKFILNLTALISDALGYVSKGVKAELKFMGFEIGNPELNNWFQYIIIDVNTMTLDYTVSDAQAATELANGARIFDHRSIRTMFEKIAEAIVDKSKSNQKISFPVAGFSVTITRNAALVEGSLRNYMKTSLNPEQMPAIIASIIDHAKKHGLVDEGVKFQLTAQII